MRAWHGRLERLSVQTAETWAPAIDVYETAAAYIVSAEVPGVAREQIRLGVESSRLTLSGRRVEQHADSGVTHFHQIERSYGAFSRTFEFGDRIDVERVTADLANGILTVTLPKVPPAPARRIEIS
jgi:HSP20 family protein